jgi:chromosome segregation ATPase
VAQLALFNTERAEFVQQRAALAASHTQTLELFNAERATITSELQRERERLHTELAQVHAERAQLNADHSQFTAEHLRFSADCSQLLADREQLRLERARFQSELTQLETARSLVDEESAKLKSERAQLTMELKAHDELVRLTSDMESALSKLQLEIQQLLKERALAQQISKSETPDSFMCPITLELMQEPVVAADGHSY